MLLPKDSPPLKKTLSEIFHALGNYVEAQEKCRGTVTSASNPNPTLTLKAPLLVSFRLLPDGSHDNLLVFAER